MKRLILAGQEPDWLLRHPRRGYIITAHLATPFCMPHSMVLPLKKEADRLTRETGIKHVMDHIVPLSHPHVCGLNVPWNIQIIPHKCNAAKSNRWQPDQLELVWE